MPTVDQLRPNLNAIIVEDDAPHAWTDRRFPHLEIPDAQAEPATTGTVCAIGPGKITRTGTRIVIGDIEVGDRVVFDPAHGLTYADDDGRAVRVLAYEDLLAIIPRTPDPRK